MTAQESLDLFGEVTERRAHEAIRDTNLAKMPKWIEVGNWVLFHDPMWQKQPAGERSKGDRIVRIERIHADYLGRVCLSLEADGAWLSGYEYDVIEQLQADPFAPEPGTEHVALPPESERPDRSYGPLCARAYRRGYVDFESHAAYAPPKGLTPPQLEYCKGWVAAGGMDPSVAAKQEAAGARRVIAAREKEEKDRTVARQKEAQREAAASQKRAKLRQDAPAAA
jgi:hypothetical protein